MPTWTPDPSFYPSPRQAAKAPPETLAYVAAFDPDRKSPDRIAVVDVDPKSSSYAKIIGNVAATEVGDEFHHFGWNACSSCLCPNAPHPHVERRYLVVPGIRSSRVYILDTKPDPRSPKIVKVIEPAGLRTRPAIPARIPSTADLAASMSRRSETRMARRPAAYSSWITRVSSPSAAGRSIVDPNSSVMTHGGISATTRW